MGLYAVALVSLVGTGTLHGLLTDRWLPEDARATIHGDELPAFVGDWTGTAVEDLPDGVREANPGGVLIRRYVNRESGDTVTVVLTVGPAGPIVASHAPDSCYPGAGFTLAAPIRKQPIAGRANEPGHEFRVADFQKTERAAPMYVRVYWSWTFDGQWRAPDALRWAFAGKRRLYKLYVIRQLARESEPIEDDAAIRFIRALAPEFQRMLTGPAA